MAAPKNHAKAGGRKAGVPNKVASDVKLLAQAHGPRAIEELARLAFYGEAEPSRIAASKELLDRAYGKARQGVDIDGTLKTTITNITRKILD